MYVGSKIALCAFAVALTPRLTLSFSLPRVRSLLPQIQQAVLATIPPRRVQKLLETGRPIDSSEFLTALSKTAYTYKNDYANYTKFTDAVTGETERRRLKELEAARAAEEKAGEQKKGPAKKKKPAA
jgi:hypothetical protein